MSLRTFLLAKQMKDINATGKYFIAVKYPLESCDSVNKGMTFKILYYEVTSFFIEPPANLPPIYIQKKRLVKFSRSYSYLHWITDMVHGMRHKIPNTLNLFISERRKTYFHISYPLYHHPMKIVDVLVHLTPK